MDRGMERKVEGSFNKMLHFPSFGFYIFRAVVSRGAVDTKFVFGIRVV